MSLGSRYPPISNSSAMPSCPRQYGEGGAGGSSEGEGCVALVEGGFCGAGGDLAIASKELVVGQFDADAVGGGEGDHWRFAILQDEDVVFDYTVEARGPCAIRRLEDGAGQTGRCGVIVFVCRHVLCGCVYLYAGKSYVCRCSTVVVIWRLTGCLHIMRFAKRTVLIVVTVFSSFAAAKLEKSASRQSMGPLAVHPKNPRYFQNTATGEAVYLTGSHTWANLVDIGPKDPSLGDRPPQFDFTAYVDWMAKLNHNFIRLWTWELVTWNTKGNGENKLHTAAPQPWARTGAEKALDGKAKFDLEKFNPEYFERLGSRIAAARQRGIYVSVMLPSPDLASTKFCLANPGKEYLIYNPSADNASFTVALAAGKYK